MNVFKLTEFDKQQQRKINEKYDYEMSKHIMISLIYRHKKARWIDVGLTMAKIEYRLTDINFHHKCSLLSQGKYNELLKEIKGDKNNG